MRKLYLAAAFGVLALLPASALAESSSSIENVQVTATRLPEPVGDVPADVGVVTYLKIPV